MDRIIPTLATNVYPKHIFVHNKCNVVTFLGKEQYAMFVNLHK